MNDLTVTVTGWAATDPKLHVGAQGSTLVSFRLASTSRYFDRAKEEWVDNPTEWFTVRAFRNAAITIKQSVLKGQPVVVHGRLKSNEWEAEDGKRFDLVIDAFAVGHDLTRGIATFTRAVGDATLDASDSTPSTDVSEGSVSDGPTSGAVKGAKSVGDDAVQEADTPEPALSA